MMNTSTGAPKFDFEAEYILYTNIILELYVGLDVVTEFLNGEGNKLTLVKAQKEIKELKQHLKRFNSSRNKLSVITSRAGTTDEQIKLFEAVPAKQDCSLEKIDSMMAEIQARLSALKDFVSYLRDGGIQEDEFFI